MMKSVGVQVTEFPVDPLNKSLGLYRLHANGTVEATAEQHAALQRRLTVASRDQLMQSGLSLLAADQDPDLVPAYANMYCASKNSRGQVRRYDIIANIEDDGFDGSFTAYECMLQSCLLNFNICGGLSGGGYFYSNGGSYCKCCLSNANRYFTSSLGNDLYRCPPM